MWQLLFAFLFSWSIKVFHGSTRIMSWICPFNWSIRIFSCTISTRLSIFHFIINWTDLITVKLEFNYQKRVGLATHVNKHGLCLCCLWTGFCLQRKSMSVREELLKTQESIIDPQNLLDDGSFMCRNRRNSYNNFVTSKANLLRMPWTQ